MKKLNEELTQDFIDKEYAHAYMNSHQSRRIATQIKVLREQRGLSQVDLANLAGMKQERISILEDTDYNSWTLATLRKLAFAFDTTLEISFVSFSHGIKDIENFSRKHLEVLSREEDLSSRKYNVNFTSNKLKESATWKNNIKNIIDINSKLIPQKFITCNSKTVNSDLNELTGEAIRYEA